MSTEKNTESATFIGGPLLILIAAILWGTTGTSQALAPIGSSPQEVGALRLLVGGGTLMLFAVFRSPVPLLNIPVMLVISSGLFVALYQLCFFWGVALTGVAVGTMVGIGSAPLFAGLLEIICGHNPPPYRWYISTGLAVTGCTLLGLSGSIEIHVSGIVLACGAGLSYAAYTLLMKKLMVSGSPETIAALVFTCGALFLLPILIGADLGWVLTQTGLIVVIHLGVFATALSYYFFCRGLERVAVSTAVTLSLIEPLTATLLGVLVVGERFTPYGMLGMSLILAGLIIMARPAKSTEQHKKQV